MHFIFLEGGGVFGLHINQMRIQESTNLILMQCTAQMFGTTDERFVNNNLWRDLTWSSPSSTRAPETTMSRSRHEPPTPCTAGEYSSKELISQILFWLFETSTWLARSMWRHTWTYLEAKRKSYDFFPNSTTCMPKHHIGVTIMERLDQGHLHPLL
jgi:hypothetical protein